jgi:hypothetical protein
MLSRYQNAAAAPESTQGDFRKEPSWATSVINLVLKILESNKNIQSIISYNTYILLYIYIYRVSQNWRTNYLLPYRGCLNVPT